MSSLFFILVFASISNANGEDSDGVLSLSSVIYERFDVYKTFWDAHDSCTEMGGQLATIHSNDENSAAGQLCRDGSQDCWIGLYSDGISEEGEDLEGADGDVLERWEWIDGSQVNFTAWNPGEPNMSNNENSCVRFRTEDRGDDWFDWRCDDRYYYICEFESERNGVFPRAECGETLTGSTDNTQNMIGPELSGEAIFSFHTDEVIFLSLDSCLAQFDTVLHIFDGNMETIVCSADDSYYANGCTNAHRTFLECYLEPGDYVFVIEGWHTETGIYSVGVECTRKAIFEDTTCGSTLRGNTERAADFLADGSNHRSGEHFYKFISPRDITITLDSCQSDFDTVMYVYNEDFTNKICENDDSGLYLPRNCRHQAKITDCILSEGEIYYFVVEGYGVESGEYSIDVICDDVPLPCPAPFEDGCFGFICSDDCGECPTGECLPTYYCSNGGEEISCGERLTGSTSGLCDTIGSWSPDYLVYITINEPTTITLNSCASNYDTFLSIMTQDFSYVLCEADDEGPCSSRAVLTCDIKDPGTYAVIIEGFLYDEGDFVVDVSCDAYSAPPPIQEIFCGDLVSGSTDDFPDRIGWSPSPDYITLINIETPSIITLDTCGSNFDTFLRVYDENLNDQICFGDDLGDCGLQSIISCTIRTTGVYAIVVEGTYDKSGEFSLAVSCEDIGSVSMPSNDEDEKEEELKLEEELARDEELYHDEEDSFVLTDQLPEENIAEENLPEEADDDIKFEEMLVEEVETDQLDIPVGLVAEEENNYEEIQVTSEIAEMIAEEFFGDIYEEYESPSSQIVETPEDQRYVLYEDRKTFYDARVTCQLLGGDLATIKNENENTQIKDTCYGGYDCWIGLLSPEGTRHENLETWEWIDGSKIDEYSNWNPGEPNFRSPMDVCARVKSFSNFGGWFDIDCLDEYHYICEFDYIGKSLEEQIESDQEEKFEMFAEEEKSPTAQNVEVESSPVDTLQQHQRDVSPSATQRRVFMFFEDLKTFSDAQSSCESMNGALVTIRNEDENDEIARLCDDVHDCWIGGIAPSDRIGDGTSWIWISDDSNMSDGYTNWNSNEPNEVQDIDVCARVKSRSAGTWFDMACDVRYQYICEFGVTVGNTPIPGCSFFGISDLSNGCTESWCTNPLHATQLNYFEQNDECLNWRNKRIEGGKCESGKLELATMCFSALGTFCKISQSISGSENCRSSSLEWYLCIPEQCDDSDHQSIDKQFEVFQSNTLSTLSDHGCDDFHFELSCDV